MEDFFPLLLPAPSVQTQVWRLALRQVPAGNRELLSSEVCATAEVAGRRILESASSMLAGSATRRRRRKASWRVVMLTTGAKEPSHTLPAQGDVPRADWQILVVTSVVNTYARKRN